VYLIRSPRRLRNGYKPGTNENQWDVLTVPSAFTRVRKCARGKWKMEIRPPQIAVHMKEYLIWTIFSL